MRTHVGVHAVDNTRDPRGGAADVIARAVIAWARCASASDLEFLAIAVCADLISVACIAAVAAVDRAVYEGCVQHALGVVGGTVIGVEVAAVLIVSTQAVEAN